MMCAYNLGAIFHVTTINKSITTLHDENILLKTLSRSTNRNAFTWYTWFCISLNKYSMSTIRSLDRSFIEFSGLPFCRWWFLHLCPFESIQKNVRFSCPHRNNSRIELHTPTRLSERLSVSSSRVYLREGRVDCRSDNRQWAFALER